MTRMLRDADVNRPLRRVKLRLRLEQIERRPDRLRAQSVPGLLIITTSQPGAKAFAANEPGFPSAIDKEIDKCSASGSVKQLASHWHVDEHGGCHYTGALPSSSYGFKAGSESAPCAIRSRRIRPSFTRVCFQSLRATLTESMPAVCHQARLSPAR